MSRTLRYHAIQFALVIAAVTSAFVASLLPSHSWGCSIAMICGWTFGIIAGLVIAHDVESRT